MTQEDKEFMTMFMIVLGVLVLLAGIFLLIARITATAVDAFDPSSVAYRAIEERIEPVGTVQMATKSGKKEEGGGTERSTPQQQTATPPAGTAPAGGQQQAAAEQVNGEAVYNQTCAACHATGVAGAPPLGDQPAWAPRIDQGVEVLYKSALQGKGTMPPKGGNPKLSEAQVKAAVDHMVAQAR